MPAQILQIKVKPQSRVSSLTQQDDGTWLAQVKSPSVDGKVNEQLIALVAAQMGCRKADVSVKSGENGRMKLVQVNNYTIAIFIFKKKMEKYTTLVKILDALRNEAPANYRRYYPLDNEVDKLNQARARAYIHLFLKVKFGLLDFSEREKYITDDTQDGGIDGYYLDQENKKFYFLQSKFRITERNFNEKEIALEELLQMDVLRILEGETVDERGNSYNNKVLNMQVEMNRIPDIGRWKSEIFVIANLNSNISADRLRLLTGGFPAIVYNNEKVYKELVFPVIQGTYYNPSELSISLNLSNKGSQSARVSYQVQTSNRNCNITLVFVPTLEIARAMHKYRNSILKFNPRSYLELSNNIVNKDIAKSITDIKTNEFALYNNGITMLSYSTDFNERIGQRDRGQLIVVEPQIINGGQTAFTLSRVYEDNVLSGRNPNVFENKEVLLKVITFQRENENSEINYLDLIKAISKATNQQSQVNEADRRSNDHIQIKLQSNLYDRYGVFYERKLGEYADGIKSGYLQRSQIIERELFLRICKCCDMEPENAKRMSSAQLFNIKNFEKTLTNPERFNEYLFAYQCFIKINKIKKTFLKIKNNKFGMLNYGSGLSQGIYGVVAVCKLQFKDDTSFEQVNDVVTSTLNKWKDFENSVIRFPENSDYFLFHTDDQTLVEKEELNFANYYKGKTVAKNLHSYFVTSGLSV